MLNVTRSFNITFNRCSECLFELSYFGEFIIDILTRPPDQQVRDCAVDQLYLLSTTSTVMAKSPRHRLLQVTLTLFACYHSGLVWSKLF